MPCGNNHSDKVTTFL